MTDAKASPYRTLTTVLFAAAAPKAVILRRGPKRHFNLIAWDLATDTFTSGQWMKGIVRMTDLSPDGDKLIYFAEQYHASAPRRPARPAGAYDPLQVRLGATPRRLARPSRKVPRYLQHIYGTKASRPLRGSWTALSPVPYFSALAIWPSLGRWTGGGTFRGDREVRLWESVDGATPIANVPIPPTMRVLSFVDPAAEGGSLRPSAYAPHTNESPRHQAIAAALAASGLAWIDWISLQQSDDMLFAGDGRVYRLRRWETVPEAQYLAGADMLIDLRDLRFTMIEAPAEAMRW